jgi:hypothetical protein
VVWLTWSVAGAVVVGKIPTRVDSVIAPVALAVWGELVPVEERITVPGGGVGVLPVVPIVGINFALRAIR